MVFLSIGLFPQPVQPCRKRAAPKLELMRQEGEAEEMAASE
jgi:hypothetical protein